MRQIVWIALSLILACQSSKHYEKTSDFVDLPKFMGVWFVVASRPTILEHGAVNGTETYRYDEKNQKIDVMFRFGDQDDPEVVSEISQTAYVHNTTTQAHWKIAPWWLLFYMDFLILDHGDDYQWAAIGVPNQDYLWILARNPVMEEEKLTTVLNSLAADGYDVADVRRMKHENL